MDGVLYASQHDKMALRHACPAMHAYIEYPHSGDRAECFLTYSHAQESEQSQECYCNMSLAGRKWSSSRLCPIGSTLTACSRWGWPRTSRLCCCQRSHSRRHQSPLVQASNCAHVRRRFATPFIRINGERMLVLHHAHA